LALKDPLLGILRGLASATLFVGGMAGIRELLYYRRWVKKGNDLFLLAEARAKKLGRPFLVVGRPILKPHGCGDV